MVIVLGLPRSLALTLSLYVIVFGEGSRRSPALRGDKVHANGRKSLKFAAAAFHLSTEGAPWPQTPALILSLSLHVFPLAFLPLCLNTAPGQSCWLINRSLIAHAQHSIDTCT